MRRTIATLIVFAAALSALPLRGAIPAGERTALIALYNAAGGPGWTDHTGWLGPAGSECTWFGVRCNDDSSAVTGIFLSNDNLTGVLPQEIGSFPALTDLSLFTNSIGGAIPPQVGNLVRLTRLELRGEKVDRRPDEGLTRRSAHNDHGPSPGASRDPLPQAGEGAIRYPLSAIRYPLSAICYQAGALHLCYVARA